MTSYLKKYPHVIILSHCRFEVNIQNNLDIISLNVNKKVIINCSYLYRLILKTNVTKKTSRDACLAPPSQPPPGFHRQINSITTFYHPNITQNNITKSHTRKNEGHQCCSFTSRQQLGVCRRSIGHLWCSSSFTNCLEHSRRLTTGSLPGRTPR